MLPVTPSTAAEMVESIDPFFQPSYCVCKTEANKHLLPDLDDSLPNAEAWTARNLDAFCFDFLSSVGQWRGRGKAWIYNLDAAIEHGVFSANSFLACAIHEAGHLVAYEISDHEYHGPGWIRSTMLCWESAKPFFNRHFAECDRPQLADIMRMANYSRSQSWEYMMALQSDLQVVNTGICSLVEILRSPMSSGFLDVCERDTRLNGWDSIKGPTSCATSAPATTSQSASAEMTDDEKAAFLRGVIAQVEAEKSDKEAARLKDKEDYENNPFRNPDLARKFGMYGRGNQLSFTN